MLNQTSQRAHEFVKAYIAENGYSPSQREIATACRLNAATVVCHLDLLEAHQLIRREPGVARSIVLCRAAEN